QDRRCGSRQVWWQPGCRPGVDAGAQVRQRIGMAVTRVQARFGCRNAGAAAGRYEDNQDTGLVQQCQTSRVRINRADQVQGNRQADSQG
ncbi:unnamed protein product, partial [Staurois parvus]